MSNEQNQNPEQNSSSSQNWSEDSWNRTHPEGYPEPTRYDSPDSQSANGFQQQAESSQQQPSSDQYGQYNNHYGNQYDQQQPPQQQPAYGDPNAGGYNNYYAAPTPSGQPAYPPQQYPQQPGMGYALAPAPGASEANTSLIWGVVGIVASLFIAIAGFICGPLALHYAKKAENLGTKATAGKVTGWIAIVIAILGVILGIILVIALFALVETVPSEFYY